MAEQLPEDWRITIDVPMSLSDAERGRLFDAIADVVHSWEPEDRDGWDAFVAAGAEDHSAEAYADRLEARIAKALERLEAIPPHIRIAANGMPGAVAYLNSVQSALRGELP